MVLNLEELYNIANQTISIRSTIKMSGPSNEEPSLKDQLNADATACFSRAMEAAAMEAAETEAVETEAEKQMAKFSAEKETCISTIIDLVTGTCNSVRMLNKLLASIQVIKTPEELKKKIKTITKTVFKIHKEQQNYAVRYNRFANATNAFEKIGIDVAENDSAAGKGSPAAGKDKRKSTAILKKSKKQKPSSTSSSIRCIMASASLNVNQVLLLQEAYRFVMGKNPEGGYSSKGWWLHEKMREKLYVEDGEFEFKFNSLDHVLSVIGCDTFTEARTKYTSMEYIWKNGKTSPADSFRTRFNALNDSLPPGAT